MLNVSAWLVRAGLDAIDLSETLAPCALAALAGSARESRLGRARWCFPKYPSNLPHVQGMDPWLRRVVNLNTAARTSRSISGRYLLAHQPSTGRFVILPLPCPRETFPLSPL